MLTFYDAARRIDALEERVAELQRAADALPMRGALRPAYLDAQTYLTAAKDQLAGARADYEMMLGAPPDLRRMALAVLRDGQVVSVATLVLRRHEG